MWIGPEGGASFIYLFVLFIYRALVNWMCYRSSRVRSGNIY